MHIESEHSDTCLTWTCLDLSPLSPLAMPWLCSQRAASSRTASRVCRKGTWSNPEKEPSKNLCLMLTWHLITGPQWHTDSWVVHRFKNVHTLLFSPSPALLGSRGDTSWSMWRRGLLERSLSATDHEKLGYISSHKCNIMELCIYNLMTADGLLDPHRWLQPPTNDDVTLMIYKLKWKVLVISVVYFLYCCLSCIFISHFTIKFR